MAGEDADTQTVYWERTNLIAEWCGEREISRYFILPPIALTFLFVCLWDSQEHKR